MNEAAFEKPMKETTLKVTLTLSGPVITASSEAGAFGVDTPFARNFDGEYFLPDTQIKGLLRESLINFANVLDLGEVEINEWFGTPSKDGSNDFPLRGRLLFQDFITPQKPTGLNRSRIKIDVERGAVLKGSYLVMEAPFKSGETAIFVGNIRFTARNDDEQSQIRDAIEKGFRLTPAFGGQRGVGFGKLTRVDVEVLHEIEINGKIAENAAPEYVNLHIRPLTPFCISKAKKDKNLFESETSIPGNVVKGCVAATLNYVAGKNVNDPIDETLPTPWTELGKHFSDIRFTHAFPSVNKTRNLIYPLSMVRAAADMTEDAERETFDVILCRGPGLINDSAPLFSIDWKHEDLMAVNGQMGWHEPDRKVLRVRTAMDPETRRSKDEALFAYEMINPAGFVWNSRVDLAAVGDKKERAKVASQLYAIMAFGLRFIGKTKANAQVETSPGFDPFYEVPNPLPGGQWVVTLQTPALMIPLEVASAKALSNDVLENKGVLFNAYNDYWREVSGQCLSLVRFFASQRLEGGYLHKRFQSEKPYNPFLLTLEKSVFLLETLPEKESNTLSVLKNWLNRGLPLAQWAITEFGIDGKVTWRQCPFIRENGFGEIAVNMECHLKYDPRKKGYEEV